MPDCQLIYVNFHKFPTISCSIKKYIISVSRIKTAGLKRIKFLTTTVKMHLDRKLIKPSCFAHLELCWKNLWGR